MSVGTLSIRSRRYSSVFFYRMPSEIEIEDCEKHAFFTNLCSLTERDASDWRFADEQIREVI